MSRVLGGKGNLEANAEEIAYHAARGATHAIWELDADPQMVIRGSLLGIAQEMGERLDPRGSHLDKGIRTYFCILKTTAKGAKRWKKARI